MRYTYDYDIRKRLSNYHLGRVRIKSIQIIDSHQHLAIHVHVRVVSSTTFRNCKKSYYRIILNALGIPNTGLQLAAVAIGCAVPFDLTGQVGPWVRTVHVNSYVRTVRTCSWWRD